MAEKVKTVYRESYELVETWLSGTRERGENRSGGLSFRGPALDVGASRLAVLARGDSGEVVVLRTRHPRSLREAHYVRVVENVASRARTTTFRVSELYLSLAHTHTRNAQDYLTRVTDALERARRSRTRGPAHLQLALSRLAEAVRYVRAFAGGVAPDVAAEVLDLERRMEEGTLLDRETVTRLLGQQGSVA